MVIVRFSHLIRVLKILIDSLLDFSHISIRVNSVFKLRYQ